MFAYLAELISTITWQHLLAVFLAACPALVWGSILMARNTRQKGLLVLIFLLGTLTVVPILGIQMVYFALIEKFPDADFVYTVKNFLSNVPYAWILLLYVYVGITEEVVKFLIVRYVDLTRPDLISTVNDSVYFAILAGLGFAFSENIFYFLKAMREGFAALFSTFVVRSVFTVCAHAMFSGIFGYFYGVSKFSREFTLMSEWRARESSLMRFWRNLFQENQIVAFRYAHVLFGLAAAMGTHALFNVYLELNKVLSAMIVVVVLFIVLTYLMRSRAGRLEFILADRHGSTMKPEDEAVVMELIGMWFNEGRYQEVINVCKNLIRRDPDNDVAKLFLAKAIDKKKGRQLFRSIKSLFAEDEGIDEKTVI
ncbi:PrsW family intramembrane metalloprotease [Candidatus Gracilibacteria bacterium]|jgi:RsiW-degrading membrane proteinase PrsW (M82 family)|nr:PrsW family intramembrane metalloprotease [Candidatus Gracilibacteria bacterium]